MKKRKKKIKVTITLRPFEPEPGFDETEKRAADHVIELVYRDIEKGMTGMSAKRV